MISKAFTPLPWKSDRRNAELGECHQSYIYIHKGLASVYTLEKLSIHVHDFLPLCHEIIFANGMPTCTAHLSNSLLSLQCLYKLPVFHGSCMLMVPDCHVIAYISCCVCFCAISTCVFECVHAHACVSVCMCLCGVHACMHVCVRNVCT